MKPFNEEGTKPWKFETKQNLHGDIIIEEIKKLPKDFEQMKDESREALGYGEAHGHIHKLFRMQDPELGSISFKLKVDHDGNRFLHVLEPTLLKHQEHSPRIIPPGSYKIGVQREYDPFTKLVRKVID